jgi:hypothetical protein
LFFGVAAMRVERRPLRPTRHRPASFDDLIGELLELRGHIEAECLGTFEVDHEIEPLRTLYR